MSDVGNVSRRQANAILEANKLISAYPYELIWAISINLRCIGKNDDLRVIARQQKKRVRNVFCRYLPGSVLIYWLDLTEDGNLHLHGFLVSAKSKKAIYEALTDSSNKGRRRPGVFIHKNDVHMQHLHEPDAISKHIGRWAWYAAKGWQFRAKTEEGKIWVKAAFAALRPNEIVGRIGTRPRLKNALPLHIGFDTGITVNFSIVSFASHGSDVTSTRNIDASFYSEAIHHAEPSRSILHPSTSVESNKPKLAPPVFSGQNSFGSERLDTWVEHFFPPEEERPP